MSRRPLCKEPPKIEGYSKVAFFIMLITTIILALVVIILLVLYFRRNSGLVDPKNCPQKVSGAVATPDTTITNLASNCGNVANCTFTVNSLQDAVDICKNLGPSKCAAFAMQQQPLSNDYTMTVSSGTATIAQANSDTYRIII